MESQISTEAINKTMMQLSTENLNLRLTVAQLETELNELKDKGDEDEAEMEG